MEENKEQIKIRKISLKTVQKNFESHRNARFSLKVYVTSDIWATNEKWSVWVEDPLQEGKTIMCTYRSECKSFPKVKLHGQYVVKNVAISHNMTKHLPTYAEYQILLDEDSQIIQVEKEPILYKPIENLAQIPKLIDVDSYGEYCDLIAIPIRDLGSRYEGDDTSPRRIKMVDGSGQHIVWTLWNEDKYQTEIIAKLMKRPLLFRNAIVKYYDGCGFDEWQMRSFLCNVVTKHPLLEEFEKKRIVSESA